MEKNNRSLLILDFMALLALGASWFFMSKYMFMKELHPNGDNYNYLNLMENMWERNGYGTSNSGKFQPSNWFPPGFPSLLYLGRWLIGNSIVAFKWMNLAFLMASVALMWNGVRRRMKQRSAAFVIGMLMLMNGGLWHFGAQLMSEMSFMFFVLLSVWSFDRLRDSDQFWKSPYFYVTLIALGASYHI